MDPTTNALNWFEIPVADLHRAKKFYEDIFDIEMNLMEFPNLRLAAFPFEPGSGKASGALASSDFHKVSQEGGALIYLNANPNLQRVLDKVESAGGSIAVPKTEIGGGFGFMAVIADSEGNQVALHSQE